MAGKDILQMLLLSCSDQDLVLSLEVTMGDHYSEKLQYIKFLIEKDLKCYLTLDAKN